LGISGGGAISTSTTSTFSILNTTSATSTITGALIVSGGVGVGGAIYAGSIVAGGVRSTTTSTPPPNPTVGDIWYNSTTSVVYRYTFDGTSYYWIDEFSSVVPYTQTVDVLSPFLLMGA
jgi:hypothetical protein